MSTKDNYCFVSSSSNETKQLDALKNLRYFSDNNGVHGTSVVNKSNVSGIFSSQPNANSQMSQLFKVPTLNNLPVNQTKFKNIRSPSIRAQAGGVRNHSKISPKKLSLIPRPSFINSSKSLHCSRSTQLNARKELIKRMVYLAECTLKENQVNQSTPVTKTLAGLTPKKTPRSGGYFMLPEFNKKLPKLEEIKSPIEDLIKKEMFSYSAKSLNEKIVLKPLENKMCDSDFKDTEEITINLQNLPETRTRINQMLNHCKLYSVKVTQVHEKIKNLDEAFEREINQIPEFRIYKAFCFYESKKDNLYKELRIIEEDFVNFVDTKLSVITNLKHLIKKREELFQSQKNLFLNFEKVIQNSLEAYNEFEKSVEITVKKINETPKLRRSVRLSKISKKLETTPMTKKLKKLDSKSKGIQKHARI